MWLVEKDEGYYLKAAPHGALKREALQTRFFHSIGLGTEVLLYHREERDWLLTARMRGEDCTHAQYLCEPERLCTCIATQLRALHEHSVKGCPIKHHSAAYCKTVEQNHAKGLFDASFLPAHLKKMTADEAFAFFRQGKQLLQDDTLLHGDYCLPNILLDDWRFSGFIDLGNGGVGDKHVDLFWGAWTIAFNLGKRHLPSYRELFFDVYGRDGIDFDRLDLIATAEAFG